VGLHHALPYRGEIRVSETTLLGERYPEIANLFDAFNAHHVV
jgi:hypothetical protein